jgi:hypothetical protein
MAVAVASGAPCLRRYRVGHRGRALLYAAEDALHIVRGRLEGICLAAGVALEGLDLQVITAPSLRLDHDDDRRRLWDTVAALRPVLLVLDPFVRLHRIDENLSGDVAPLLAYLRDIQRRFSLAVAVVHHAKKGAQNARDGQALRGSSEFHAWGDSNLYLRRRGEQLLLSIEHRAAASTSGVPLALRGDDAALALEVIETRAEEVPPAVASDDLLTRVEQVLADAKEPLSVAALRAQCRIRTQNLTRALADLVAAGRAVRLASGYQLHR